MLVNRKNLDVVDISTLAYNSIVALIVLGSYQRLHSWGLQILINLSIIALILFAFSHIDERAPPILRFLKSFYPLPLFIVFYEQAGNIDRVLFRESLDPLFEQVELAVFGFQPATRFSQAFPSIWLAEYMHFAYFSYYFLIPSLGLILYLQNGRCDLKAYLFAACNTLYICCLIFIFVPVVGPDRAGLTVFPGGKLFIPLVQTIVSRYDIDGGSLPSSHVALTVVVLYYAYRQGRQAFAIYATLCVSLIFATVYCGIHYAIDAITGIITAAVVIAVSDRILARRAPAQRKVCRPP